MVFLNALECMLTISLLSLIGYVLAWKGWIAREVEIFIPRFVTQVVVPPYLAGAVIRYFDRDQFPRLLLESLVPLAGISLSFIAFYLLCLLFRVDRRHRGLAATAASCSNTIFIGIPVNSALFGEAGLVHLLLYFLAQTFFFWTVGNYVIAKEGASTGGRLTPGEILRRIFSAPLLGTLTGLALLLLDVPLPRFVTDTCTMLGGLGMPLALIFVGVILRRIDWKTAHMGKDMLLTLMGRFLLSPLIMIALFHFLPINVPDLSRQVDTIQSALPTMTQVALLSAFYDADREFGSAFVCLTSIVGLLAVPVWMAVLDSLVF